MRTQDIGTEMDLTTPLASAALSLLGTSMS